MSLKKLLSEKKLEEYKTTGKQIKDILVLIERDIKDSRIADLSVDRKFMSLYSAALLLATVVLYINGYRTRGESHHHTTFETAKILLPDESDVVDYFDRCRILRNKTEYERSGLISESEIKSLSKRVEYFRRIVLKLVNGYTKTEDTGLEIK